ncbi:uncharacterized protein BP5553_02991 [Venustampulla echinocandica]|uniref:PNPLA domain-containing protein n=1 Tax=Venustampulla echinocandica TaxID=2656787 RepID=A0A370TSZ0_9HELO|nr:uncharacterized protein BP5553_02991 [Venustampulla echinocandica]RDL38651.1 hypothetical protein BP5553_02991 [Venustampulla echinocandica]
MSPNLPKGEDDLVRPRLLSLDGGGVKGLSALLILGRLMQKIDPENPPKPCEVFDMIGGTSTGGLIAIMLGSLEMSVDECIKAYKNMTHRIFQRSLRGYFLSIPYVGQIVCMLTGWSIYDSQVLEDAVKDIIEACGLARNSPLKRLDDHACKVFVCATKHLDNSRVQLCSYPDPRGGDQAKGVKIWEAARATSAAPTYFDPITIGPYSTSFVDGGLKSNNPVYQTLKCAENLWEMKEGERIDEQIQSLVSVGTGAGKPFGASVPELVENGTAILTQTEDTAKMFSSGHRRLVESKRYFRFTVPLGIGIIDLADTSKFAEISANTITYMDGNTQLDECAQTLKRKYRPGKSASIRRPSFCFATTEPPKRQFSCGWVFFMVLAIFAMVCVIETPRIDNDAPIIAIMGQTGAGKSTFINSLGGRHIQTGRVPTIGHGLESETSKVSWYRALANGRTVYIIDSPGFDDDNHSDRHILHQVSKDLEANYKNGKLLNGIVFLHDITQTRIGGKGQTQLKYLKLFLGNEAYSHCALVANQWELDSSTVQKQQTSRLEALKGKHWKDMIDGGSSVFSHDDSYTSASRIVAYLVDKPRIVLHHQYELLDEKRNFWQTLVGKEAQDDLKLDDLDLRDPTITEMLNYRGLGIWNIVEGYWWQVQVAKWHIRDYFSDLVQGAIWRIREYFSASQ